MIIYVPPIPLLDATYDLLLSAGCRPLAPHDQHHAPVDYALAV